MFVKLRLEFFDFGLQMSTIGPAGAGTFSLQVLVHIIRSDACCVCITVKQLVHDGMAPQLARGTLLSILSGK